MIYPLNTFFYFKGGSLFSRYKSAKRTEPIGCSRLITDRAALRVSLRGHIFLWDKTTFSCPQESQVKIQFNARVLFFQSVQNILIIQGFAAYRKRTLVIDVWYPTEQGISGSFSFIKTTERFGFAGKSRGFFENDPLALKHLR